MKSEPKIKFRMGYLTACPDYMQNHKIDVMIPTYLVCSVLYELIKSSFTFFK